MIQNLIQAITTLLQENLQGVQVQVGKLAAAAAPAALPTVAVYPGTFTISQASKDVPSPPREQAIQQTITLGANTSSHVFYPLDYLAVDQTVTARLLQPDGAVELLGAGQDFSVDYNQSTIFFFGNKINESRTIVIEYTSLQSVLVREFQQELGIALYAASLNDAEQWASLVCNIVLNSTNILLDACNNPPSPIGYRSRLFVTVHTLTQLLLVSGTPAPAGNAWGYQVTFTAAGQLRMIKQFQDAMSIIREVVVQQGE